MEKVDEERFLESFSFQSYVFCVKSNSVYAEFGMRDCGRKADDEEAEAKTLLQRLWRDRKAWTT